MAFKQGAILFGLSLLALATIEMIAGGPAVDEEALELESREEALFNPDKAWAWHKGRSTYKGNWGWYSKIEKDRERTRNKLGGVATRGLEQNVRYTTRHIQDFWKHAQSWSQES